VRIYLMWARDARTGAGLDPEVVARSLQDVLAPLFTAPPPVAIEAIASAAMVFMQLPSAGGRRRSSGRTSTGARTSPTTPSGSAARSRAAARGRGATRLTRDDGPWTDVFDAARVRSAAGAPPVEVALVALAAEALAPADLFPRAGI
jgi:hypothetical protein